MTGEETYQLLRDLTGSKTYENSRAESDVLIQKTEKEINKS